MKIYFSFASLPDIFCISSTDVLNQDSFEQYVNINCHFSVVLVCLCCSKLSLELCSECTNPMLIWLVRCPLCIQEGPGALCISCPHRRASVIAQECLAVNLQSFGLNWMWTDN